MSPVPPFQSDRPTETAGPFCRLMIWVMSFLFAGLVPIVGFHLLAASMMGRWYIFLGDHAIYSSLLNLLLFFCGGMLGLLICFQTLKELKEDSEKEEE